MHEEFAYLSDLIEQGKNNGAKIYEAEHHLILAIHEENLYMADVRYYKDDGAWYWKKLERK